MTSTAGRAIASARTRLMKRKGSEDEFRHTLARLGPGGRSDVRSRDIGML